MGHTERTGEDKRDGTTRTDGTDKTDGTEETDLSPVSVLLLLLEDDDTEDTDTEDTEDEDLGTGLRVTAEVGGGGGMRPGPAA